MKNIFFATILSLMLASCDTIGDISMPSMPEMPSMSSLNPFGDSESSQKEAKIDKKTTNPQAVANSSALETELAEMELLTGVRPSVSERKEVEMPAAPVAEVTAAAVEAPQPPVAEKIAEPVQKQAPAPTQPEMKPVEMAKIEKPATEAKQKLDDLNHIPSAPAPEKVAEITQDKIQQEMVVTEKPVVEPQVPDVTPITETPIAPQTIPQDNGTTTLATAKGCPHIEIMPAARSMTLFENEMSGEMTARASISEIRGGCEVVSGGMEIDLDIIMRGTITNKGRFEGKQNEEAFMTFPYFISVSTPQGLPVDKKIMATAMRFQPSVDFLDHAEKITQFVPIDNIGEAQNYKITVGYQLTRKQLEYNRAQASARPDNKRVSPDTIPARRLSVNPLAH
jgi:hypothetical protein